MKTRIERAYVEAALIGDSHASFVWKHLAPEVAFRQTMTTTAKHFDGEFFALRDGRLHMSSEHLSAAFPRANAETLQALARGREHINGRLQAIQDAQLPVISSIGAANYRFTRRVSAGIQKGGENVSRKMLLAAANDHIKHFVSFHRELLNYVPSVTFMLGACRYPPQEKAAWLAYDQAISERMAEIGIDVIDIRAETGDDELRMLPEYEADDILHGGPRWCEAVAQKIFAIVGEPTKDIRPADNHMVVSVSDGDAG